APAAPSPQVLLARARALRAEGDVAGARARLEEAVGVAPPSDELRIELADLLVGDGREPDRAAELLAGVAARDGNARWFAVSGQLAELRGDPAGAATDYAGALAIADDSALRLRRAVVLEALGRAGEAVGELERVRKDRPEDAFVRSRLAACYEAAGRLREAETELVALAGAAPERPGDWERLAAFYRRTGRHDAARRAEARADAVSGRHERNLRPLKATRR
ncbi:tetratricopeptide repeat protein, partial [Anaeromyxobacter oryzisoli]|uniref:tetratricopeptide repeat protein n=1 Tax=Anaeromyxobacter oryzisoli TaxID=2925408 RepID=UPI001F5AE730